MGTCVRCGLKFPVNDFDNSIVDEEKYSAHDGDICYECLKEEEQSLDPDNTPSQEKFLPGQGEGTYAKKSLPWKKQRRIKPEWKRF